MKVINKIVFVLILLVYFTSCKKEPNIFEYTEGAYTHFNGNSYDFIVTPEDTGHDIGVGTTTSAAATVELSIDPSSTAIEGVHFEAFNKTVSIGQGEFSKTITIVPKIENLDGNYTLIIHIDNPTVPEGIKFDQTFTMNLSRFCSLDLTEWVGVTFNCNEPGYGDYDVSFTAGTEPNTLVLDNFWDYGGTPVYTFSESSSPDEAIVTLEEQTVVMGGTEFLVLGSGTYEQCSKTMIVDYQVLRPSDRAAYDINTHTYTLK